MARGNSVNYTGPLQFPYATAGTDIFKKEDVQTLAQAVDAHDHSTGKGLVVNVAGLPAGAIDGSKITDGKVTSAKIQDGTIATADLANQAVTNAKLGTDTARLNLLTNGGFEIWQRGNGPFTVANAYAADRWQILLAAGDTLSVSRDTANIAATGSAACAACTYTRSAGGTGLVNPAGAEVSTLRGLTVTMSVRVRTSTANAVRLRCNDGVTGLQYGAYHTGGGSYETLTLTYAIAATATALNIGPEFQQSCTAYLDNAMLVVGSVPADYAPLHPADDLARCLRYYETAGSVNQLYAGWAGAANEALGVSVRWQVQKSIVPTVTKIASGSLTNCGAATISGPSVDGTQIYANATAIGHVQYTGVAWTGEANP